MRDMEDRSGSVRDMEDRFGSVRVLRVVPPIDHKYMIIISPRSPDEGQRSGFHPL